MHTLNAARVLGATAGILGVGLEELDRLAQQARPGAEGLVLLPYLGGERTPNLPEASGSLLGLRNANMSPHNMARAAVEGMLCGMADALDELRGQSLAVDRVVLIGGAARAHAVGQVAAQVFGSSVTVPEPDEYVALGAARQAAWALSGAAQPPRWPLASAVDIPGPTDGSTGERIRRSYAEARQRLYG